MQKNENKKGYAVCCKAILLKRYPNGVEKYKFIFDGTYCPTYSKDGFLVGWRKRGTKNIIPYTTGIDYESVHRLENWWEVELKKEMFKLPGLEQKFINAAAYERHLKKGLLRATGAYYVPGRSITHSAPLTRAPGREDLLAQRGSYSLPDVFEAKEPNSIIAALEASVESFLPNNLLFEQPSNVLSEQE